MRRERLLARSSGPEEIPGRISSKIALFGSDCRNSPDGRFRMRANSAFFLEQMLDLKYVSEWAQNFPSAWR